MTVPLLARYSVIANDGSCGTGLSSVQCQRRSLGGNPHLGKWYRWNSLLSRDLDRYAGLLRHLEQFSVVLALL